MILSRMSLRSYLILILSVLSVMSLTSFRRGASPARASRQADTPNVRSYVPNLTVVDVHVEDGAVSLSLRNDYNEIITAFAVSSSGVTTRSDLIDTDQIMAPGTIRTKSYELPSSQSPKYATIIQAVVFDDGTTIGNPKIIRQILDARAGCKAQIDRIRPILNFNARKGDLKQQWQFTRSKIGELPDQQPGKSFEFNAALQDAKHLAMMKVNELEVFEEKHGEDVARQRLTHINELYDVKSKKLQAFLDKFK